MISIGAVYGGPEQRGACVYGHISLLMNSIATIRLLYPNIESRPSINVVFQVPGSLSNPDFEGIRDATFSRRKKLLLIQVAVPEDMLDSPDLDAFLIDSLHGANAVAFHYFADRGMDYPLREAEELVEKAREAFPRKTGANESPPSLRSVSAGKEIPPLPGPWRATENASLAAEAQTLDFVLLFRWKLSESVTFEAIASFEDYLIESIEGKDAELDGNEVGEGEMDVFVHTNNPGKVFASVKRELNKRGLIESVTVAFRKVEDGDYTTIWPKGAPDFSI